MRTVYMVVIISKVDGAPVTLCTTKSANLAETYKRELAEVGIDSWILEGWA